MTVPLIAVVNESTAWADDIVDRCVNALRSQVQNDFAPVWGANARIQFLAKSAVTPDMWVLACLDDADQAGALGYHETTAAGMPLGKVFIRTTLNDGGMPSVTMSHELLEMLADPWINRAAFQSDGSGNGVWYAWEVCDACEDDSYSYDIDGVAVSDFVYPAWFWQDAPAAQQYDHGNHITAPMMLLAGGYISRYVNGGWTQITGDAEEWAQYKVLPGSRRDRRANRHKVWRPSLPFAGREAPNG